MVLDGLQRLIVGEMLSRNRADFSSARKEK